jgi:hypothetical protein
VRYHLPVTFNWLSNLALIVVPRLQQRAELRARWGRVLELMGIPEDIIGEALVLAARQSEKNTQ